MASGPPIFAGGHSSPPAFAQQGQVDWVAFGNMAWNMTSATLQRFSAADVQPVTYGAAIAFGCRFKLGPIGNRRIEHAIKNLQGSPSFRKNIWFGFGYKSFVHVLSETQAGFNCMALCACLAEVHSHEVAGEVLSELWQSCGFPEEYEPSHTQFVNLLKVCEGVLADSSFGATCQQMANLRNLVIEDSESNRKKTRSRDKCAKSKNIATVLCALFDISKNKAESIEIAGGAECSFIGAVAQWLLDLDVYVIGTSDHGPQGKKPNVIVQYDTLREEDHLKSSNGLQSATYYLNDVDDYWSQISSTDAAESRFILRVPWETALSRTFGTDFDRLCEVSFSFAEFLGSAARIYSALAVGEADLGVFDDCRESFSGYLDNSHGPGLVSSIMDTFPELGTLEGFLKSTQNAQGTSFQQAVASCQRSVSSIVRYCECSACNRRNSKPLHAKSAENCILRIVYAVLHISVTLAAVLQHPGLLPTISGIRHFYTRAPRNKSTYHADGQNNAKQKDLPELLGLGVSGGDFDSLDYSVILYSGSSSFRAGGPIHLRDEATARTALSHKGICGYSSILRHLNGQPDVITLIHVLPGHIQRGWQRFDAVYDEPEDTIGRNYLRERLYDLNSLDTSRGISAARADLRASVTTKPGAKALYFSYSLALNPSQTFQKGVAPSFRIHPGLVANEIMRTSCLIPCRGGKDCHPDGPLETQECPQMRIPLGTRTENGEWIFCSKSKLQFETGFACTVSQAEEDDIDLCIAVQLHHIAQATNVKLLIRRHECLPCTTRAVMRLGNDVLKARQKLKGYKPTSELDNVAFHVFSACGPGSYNAQTLAADSLRQTIAATDKQSCTLR